MLQRAKLLFELLPADIPEYLAFAQSVADQVKNNPDSLRERWTMEMFNPDLWIRLAHEVSAAIEKTAFNPRAM